MEKIAVTIPEAVAISGLGRSTLYKLFSEGKIQRRKSGNRTLIILSELNAYVHSLPVAA